MDSNYPLIHASQIEGRGARATSSAPRQRRGLPNGNPPCTAAVFKIQTRYMWRSPRELPPLQQSGVAPFLFSFLFSFLMYYSQASSWVIQTSMSLTYEPSSEPLHISVKQLFLVHPQLSTPKRDWYSIAGQALFLVAQRNGRGARVRARAHHTCRTLVQPCTLHPTLALHLRHLARQLTVDCVRGGREAHKKKPPLPLGIP